jgi:hypothetical protein
MNFAEGTLWSEGGAGTNAIGIALAAEHAVQVFASGDNKFEIVYDEALGWDEFANDDFEEVMSTHDGRMVALDDRIIMFANPEMRRSRLASTCRLCPK